MVYTVPIQWQPSHSDTTVSSEMPSQNMPVQSLKVAAVLPLDLPSSGLIMHSEEILTIGKPHVTKLDRLFPKDSGMKNVL
jgi:hypothetical protein